jgi:hypothetical protein
MGELYKWKKWKSGRSGKVTWKLKVGWEVGGSEVRSKK